MAHMEYEDGIWMLVATPHTGNGFHKDGRPTILARGAELNHVLTSALDPDS